MARNSNNDVYFEKKTWQQWYFRVKQGRFAGAILVNVIINYEKKRGGCLILGKKHDASR